MPLNRFNTFVQTVLLQRPGKQIQQDRKHGRQSPGKLGKLRDFINPSKKFQSVGILQVKPTAADGPPDEVGVADLERFGGHDCGFSGSVTSFREKLLDVVVLFEDELVHDVALRETKVPQVPECEAADLVPVFSVRVHKCFKPGHISALYAVAFKSFISLKLKTIPRVFHRISAYEFLRHR